MQKKAKTQFPIEMLLAQRWSPRAFSGRPVEPEKLLSLMEAARWAPSCFNEQPEPEYGMSKSITRPDKPPYAALQKNFLTSKYCNMSSARKFSAPCLRRFFGPSSRSLMPYSGWSFLVVTKEDAAEYERLLHCLVAANRRWAVAAPVLMLSVTRLHFARNNKPNRYAFHDVGLAVGTLLVQASAMGLYLHQMVGFDRERARTVFEIPDTHEPVAAMALGYLGDPAQLPEDLRQREVEPRKRNALSAFVFGGRWQERSRVPHIPTERV